MGVAVMVVAAVAVVVTAVMIVAAVKAAGGGCVVDGGGGGGGGDGDGSNDRVWRAPQDTAVVVDARRLPLPVRRTGMPKGGMAA